MPTHHDTTLSLLPFSANIVSLNHHRTTSIINYLRNNLDADGDSDHDTVDLWLHLLGNPKDWRRPGSHRDRGPAQRGLDQGWLRIVLSPGVAVRLRYWWCRVVAQQQRDVGVSRWSDVDGGRAWQIDTALSYLKKIKGE